MTVLNAENSILTRLEDITSLLQQKLVDGDTASVESLVVEQCDCLRLLTGKPLTANDLNRLSVLKYQVVLQQKLIEQALGVTEYFLGTLHQQNSVSYEG